MNLIPTWRLREIRNLADTIAFRAACCPMATFTAVAEEELLRPEAHIVLHVEPGDQPEARFYEQRIVGHNPKSEALVEMTRAVICFSGDLTTKEGWDAVARYVTEWLAYIVMFTDLLKKPSAKKLTPAQQKLAIHSFVDELMELRDHEFEFARPRFSLAKIRQIVEENMKDLSGAPIQMLLLPYLGPDGW